MRRLLAAISLCLLPLAGCNIIGGIGGVIADRAYREGSHQVDAEYRGLEGKSFAVLVTASPSLQSTNPQLTARLAMTVSEVLAAQVNAERYVPGDRVVEFQYNRPNWVARPLGEVAKELGVSRIIFVDITEYRLRDPGNKYIWSGVASAQVGVVEADSALPDDLVYQKRLEVKFPDTDGYSPTDLPEGAVNTELTRRLCDRISWLFFTHEEPNIIKY